MVCLGNICRSPLAQGILESLTDSQSYYVDSAGTANYHIGKAPDYRSIVVASKHGINIGNQRCRQFTTSDFDQFDLIFAMDRENLNNIRSKARTSKDLKKVMLILEHVGSEILDVPDPYYGSTADFEAVFQLLQEACLKFLSSQ
jgi:protein-tyrosine phosphatase